MPLYEYVCGKCSHQFEELVFGDASVACPRCGATRVARILSIVSVGRSGGKDAAPAVGACGRCGDPRGPGACSTS